ncbi:MAG: hypothetical protein WCE63_04155 [Acidobacteriaceae bacterium]
MARLEQRLSADDGKVYLNHHLLYIWLARAIGLIHRQYALDEWDE